MINRTTAVAFLMLANILLLAHAVVPHHHHNHQVCFVNSHCNHDDPTHEHDRNRDSHSHDGENNHDNCVLKEPVAVFSNQWKIDLKITDITDRTGADDFHNCALCDGTEFQCFLLSSFIYELNTGSSYPSLVSSSLGLRAPPVV
jgi:hypothetical protein